MAVCNILSCIFLFLSWSHILSTDGARDVRNLNVIPPPTCSWSKKDHAYGGLKIINKYGRCSPLGQSNFASYSGNMLHKDNIRVQAINANLKNNNNIYTTQDSTGGSKSTPIKIQPTPGASVYLIRVGFGSRKREFNLLLDTGSDITWMQCQPISGKSFTQNEAMFDPSESSTFSKESCHPLEPKYHVSYLDNSDSSGYYGCDTLTISDHERYPNFLFGCGDDNSGKFSGAAGVFALGRDGSAAARFAQEFCFCLPVKKDSDGYLYFGQEAQQKCKTENTLHLLRGSGGHFYVKLVGISIGKRQLSISSYSKTIIDSGTVITRLPQSVYLDLRSKFKKSMTNHTEVGPQDETLDTCYNFEVFDNQYPTIPPVGLRFEGSNHIDLGREAVLIKMDDPSLYCLAFSVNDKEDDLIIIGSHQLRGLNMHHNTKRGTIGYGKGNC